MPMLPRSPRIGLWAMVWALLSTTTTWAQGPSSRAMLDAEVHPAVVDVALESRREHISIHPLRLAALGGEPGRQVRVYKDPSTFVLFTLRPREERTEAIVRMGAGARRRFGREGFEVFAASVAIAAAPRSELSDEEARSLGELVERLDDDGEQTGLLILAPHGGEIERGTDLQAARMKAKLERRRASTWIVKGFDPPGPQTAHDRWHISSTEIHEASFPLLARISGRSYEYAVSFHGKPDEGIVIGGGGPLVLKQQIGEALARTLGDRVKVEIAPADHPLAGVDAANIVNRYTLHGGVQIEQGPHALRDHWRAIADAIADVYRPAL